MKRQILINALSFFAGVSVSVGTIGAVTKRVSNVKIAIEKREIGLIPRIWEARDRVIVGHGELLETLANRNGKIELEEVKDYAITYRELNRLENIE